MAAKVSSTSADHDNHLARDDGCRYRRPGLGGRSGASVVSMPSWELFEQQDQAYRDALLPAEVEGRVAVEQAATLEWDRYLGHGGAMIGMHTFGASAPLAVLQKQLGFTVDAVVDAARKQARRAN